MADIDLDSSTKEMSARMQALANELSISNPTPLSGVRIRNSYRVIALIFDLSSYERSWLVYWLSRSDRNCRLKGTAVVGSSPTEKAALLDFLETSGITNLELRQLEDFPDFVAVENEVPVRLIEIARVTHQAVEEMMKTTAVESLWKSGKKRGLYSNTPVVKFNDADKRYNPGKIVRSVKNGGPFAEWMDAGAIELQCAGRAFDELLSKVRLVPNLAPALASCRDQVIILDIALDPYGLHFLSYTSGFEIVKRKLKESALNEQEITNWLGDGGQVYLRIERSNSESRFRMESLL